MRPVTRANGLIYGARSALRDHGGIGRVLDAAMPMGVQRTATLTMVPGRPRSHLVDEVHAAIHARLAELDHSAN